MSLKVFGAVVVVLGLLSAPVAAAGNAEDGEGVFKKCMTCHRIGPDAKNLIGPNLTGVIGRTAGTREAFAYSDLMVTAGKLGLVWTEDLISKYVEEPTSFLKDFITAKGKPDLADGAAKMAFKLPDDQDRLDVIAYIKTFQAK